jgi:hypothetical protein
MPGGEEVSAENLNSTKEVVHALDWAWSWRFTSEYFIQKSR